MTTKKPVYILSGFLGSGKTTLLKQLIKFEKDQSRKPAVLMNEAGSVSIDSSEVDEGIPLAELLDGCICCTIQEKLESQLQSLLIKEEFDSLIIETTGAAHPVEVVDSVMSPLFAHHFDFKGIVTIVDVHQWSNRSAFPVQVLQLMREQVRHAGVILLNKTDLINDMQAASIVGELQEINPDAQIIMTTYSSVNPSVLHSLGYNRKESVSVRADKDLNLNTVVYTFNHRINRHAFEEWLKAQPDHIYRIKGFVPFEDEKYPVLFQYSYGMPLYFLQDMNMPTNLVVIGSGLDKKLVADSLLELEQKHESG
ncbi:CobW family GTP-binding protein [Jeotgalibacillus aurantiacus]|uniref:CobW family GTP-binding protein n=1 Tax=Jeotgalibacillus aurantiacus TaxID=2763266 RepID=UPI001D0BDB42|nr:GTP-binding protein [Jeotgalibacillus aurantiacus]